MPVTRKQTNSIPLRTKITPDLYRLFKDFQKQHEIASEAEIIRMALAKLLKEPNNFLLLNNFKKQTL